MAVVSSIHQDMLPKIKTNIGEAYIYFEKNREYYNKMRRFVLQSTIPPDQKAALDILERNALQFNVLEAYISRLVGEYSKQVPGIETSSEPTDEPASPDEIAFVSNHMRYILQTLNSDKVYHDQLTGGFSCLKVWTEYENPKSFNNKICLDRVFDPLLVGFDPAAQKSHKGDGSYAFEIIPLTEDQFKELHPDVNIDNCFKGSMEGFQWGYKSGKKRIILLCDYYEKKNRRVMIYRLSDNRVRTKKEYEAILADYIERQDVREPPSIIDKRMTEIPYVCRYQLIGDQILDYKETIFSRLPLIFVDGNSVLLRQQSSSSDTEQVVKAYAHNAMDAQRLKNVAGQTIANEIENMVQHKMKIALEGIPNGQEKAYTNPQMASNYIYKAYGENDLPLPAPQEVMKMPIPQEVLATFMQTDQIIQAALGSYDASLGINDNQLSGVAIVEGATQSNAAGMPYIINNLEALQQASEIILDVIPKIYVTPRSVPIVTEEGKREHISINNPKDPNSLMIRYDPSDLKVRVKAGVNFDIQKTKALQRLESLSQVFPAISAMINEVGIPIIFDNLDIKGADQLKALAEEWMEKQKANQQQQGQQPNPMMLKIQMEGQIAEMKNQIDQIVLQQKQQLIDLKQQEVGIKQQDANREDAMAQIDAMNDRLDSVVQLKKAQTEREVHGVNAMMEQEKNDRDHALQVAKHQHDVNQHHHQIANDLINHAKSEVNQEMSGE